MCVTFGVVENFQLGLEEIFPETKLEFEVEPALCHVKERRLAGKKLTGTSACHYFHLRILVHIETLLVDEVVEVFTFILI